MRIDDLERLPADRARGAEKGDTLHGSRSSVDAAPPSPPLAEVPSSDLTQRARTVERGRAGDEQAVDPVQHASVPGQQAPGVFDPDVALDED